MGEQWMRRPKERGERVAASATRVGEIEIEWNLGRRAVLLLRRTHCEVLYSLSLVLFCSVPTAGNDAGFLF